MGNTVLTIQGEDFFINGIKTYAEIKGSRSEAQGLLMNARFIQGVFDDKAAPERFNRFGRTFCPERNTDYLIKALPQWHRYGLRAFTVGFQGGGPCFTLSNDTIENNPFGEEGTTLDPAYRARMHRLILAADQLGMAVIVSFFYPGQVGRIRDGRAVMNAVKTASRFLRDGGYTNVIIEICNEMDVDKSHPIIHQPEGMAVLMEMAREESGGMPVGCSGGGGSCFEEVTRASDVILIHGNGCSRQGYYNLVERVRRQNPGRPIVCNEDSQAIGQMKVSFGTHTSWGYYNNLTKQEPPADWSVLPGEDLFFAHRMAQGIGIDVPEIPLEEQICLLGTEEPTEGEGNRWIRVASLYPESIDTVSFYSFPGISADAPGKLPENSRFLYICHDEPFSLYYIWNWLQGPWKGKPGEQIAAVVRFRNGEMKVLR